MYGSAHYSSFNRNLFISNDSIQRILNVNREAEVIPVFILNIS